MPQVREREVEKYLVEKLKSIGLDCIKFVPDQRSGMPDRLVTLPGERVCWIETKKPSGGRVSVIQKYRHTELREAGQRVEIVWTKEQADDLVRELEQEIKKTGEQDPGVR